ncbi:gamma-glutamyl hydrolase-like isoform X2 [Homalodisca vitripennis]|nr:gamma-glutamyl hydrolase-like isoform X2 [Homalodisca vitripennis]XP_046678475.1 gamma-glutamyl hydrolase-like isoform X2 [Homalodisca vitripennis]
MIHASLAVMALALLPMPSWAEFYVRGTSRPIIGVLAQEIPKAELLRYPDKSSYIPASYVKAIESSGARVVPIFIRRSQEYYERILKSVNGMVFPGGAVKFEDPNGYAAAGRMILNIVQQLQDSGVNFPILGVCQGYELLMYLTSNSTAEEDILVKCNSSNEALPLMFKVGYHQSRLYRFASKEIVEILMTQPVTSNHHGYCVTEDMLKFHKLEKVWRVLSTNKDMDGLEFISSSEQFQRPIVGVQFHPEKNMFEWNPKQANPHSRKAILSARHFYDWLVMESRANDQTFSSEQEEDNNLIYNYCPVFTGRKGGYDEQVYIF